MKNKLIKYVSSYGLLVILLFIIFAIASYYWPKAQKFGITPDSYVTAWILMLTMFVIIFYTIETSLLRETEQNNLKYQKSPFIIVHFEKPDCFILKNVGKGVARNISWKVRGADQNIKFPTHTAISPNSRYAKMRDSDYQKYGPAHGKKHIINIEYEDCDGLKYSTRLQSGISVDDYEVLYYGK